MVCFMDLAYSNMVIGIAKGKKVYDKRQSIKEREDKIIMSRMMKH